MKTGIVLILVGILIFTWFYIIPEVDYQQKHIESNDRIIIPSCDINQSVNYQGVDYGVYYKEGVLFGHRTTHGAPFYNLDNLQIGDEVIFNGTSYHVINKTIVAADYVLQPIDGHLYLSTCTLDAKERILIDTIKEDV
jgi:sortase (surface protein transpeptidase)